MMEHFFSSHRVNSFKNYLENHDNNNNNNINHNDAVNDNYNKINIYENNRQPVNSTCIFNLTQFRSCKHNYSIITKYKHTFITIIKT